MAAVEMTRVENDTRLWTGHATRYGLTLVFAGAFDFWYRRRVSTHGVGLLKLKEPGEVHRDVRVHAPVTAASLAISAAAVEAVAVACGRAKVPHFAVPVTQGGGRAEALALRLHDAVAAGDRFGQESLLVETLAALWEDYGEAPRAERVERSARAVRRVREYLLENWRGEVTLDAMAAAAGRSKFHVLRLFREEYGLAPYEYVTHLRVAQARLLLEAGAPAAQVALNVGFYDQSQLHRHFKRITGTTPARYAKDARAGAGRAAAGAG
ncbi:AraC family transcriptional regulator [Pendulispora brunnea]|uniref:AraC family transcriptional regulator n=1 Tax=Pendulispora brunnea TaxID=2905690 RepID=A0ABZ2K7H6_9BACT